MTIPAFMLHPDAGMVCPVYAPAHVITPYVLAVHPGTTCAWLRSFMTTLRRCKAMTTKRLEELAREGASLSLWLMAVMLNMTAVLWLGFQGLQWLHDGHWTNQPTVLTWIHGVCPGACDFLNHPHSWYGAVKLARFLSEVPTGLALALIGLALGVLSVSVSDRRPVAPRVTGAHLGIH